MLKFIFLDIEEVIICFLLMLSSEEAYSFPNIPLKCYFYQLLHQYHKILAACNIQGERACEFSFNIAQS